MEITFEYEVVGSYPVTINIDEEELQKDGWDEMTKDEKIGYLMDTYGYKTMCQAECECNYSIGSLDYIEFDGEEQWVYCGQASIT